MAGRAIFPIGLSLSFFRETVLEGRKEGRGQLRRKEDGGKKESPILPFIRRREKKKKSS